MIEFNYYVEDDLQKYTAKRRVSMQISTEYKSIGELTEAFQDFLCAVGYVIDPIHQKIMLVESDDGAF